VNHAMLLSRVFISSPQIVFVCTAHARMQTADLGHGFVYISAYTRVTIDFQCFGKKLNAGLKS